jgi:hypothetical protein
MKLDYQWTNIGAAPTGFTTGYTMGTYGEIYTSSTIHQVLTNASGINGAGKTISSILQIKLYRDDNVYTGDLLVTSFDIHFEIDAIGSGTEYSK